MLLSDPVVPHFLVFLLFIFEMPPEIISATGRPLALVFEYRLEGREHPADVFRPAKRTFQVLILFLPVNERAKSKILQLQVEYFVIIQLVAEPSRAPAGALLAERKELFVLIAVRNLYIQKTGILLFNLSRVGLIQLGDQSIYILLYLSIHLSQSYSYSGILSLPAVNKLLMITKIFKLLQSSLRPGPGI